MKYNEMKCELPTRGSYRFLIKLNLSLNTDYVCTRFNTTRFFELVLPDLIKVYENSKQHKKKKTQSTVIMTSSGYSLFGGTTETKEDKVSNQTCLPVDSFPPTQDAPDTTKPKC